MDTYITSLAGRTAPSRASSSPKANASVTFAERLKEYSDKTTPAEQRKTPSGSVTLVGEISRSRQTVSELLVHNPDLRKSTWNILSAEPNRGKDYTQLPPGTRIYYNSEDKSLSWSGASQPSAPSPRPRPAAPTGDDQPILLGRIDSGNPTVSHLLHQHPELGRQTWAVLANDLNRQKPFAEIKSGTEIYLQPGSMEIVWGKMSGNSPVAASTVAAAAEPAQESVKTTGSTTGSTTESATGSTTGSASPGTDPAADLTEAVQPFLGTPYKEINCYELLVKGLERMHIRYSGKDGLFSKLTRMAHEKGLPTNAYLNGEGIVKAAGSLVLSKSYSRPTNWKRAAEQLYREMEPLLDKGQILSFSTQSRGHTGIISQQQNQWTFINSGRLDNSLTTKSPANGVGEEVLQNEIRNWFKLANASHEPLTVTLGALGQESVVTALNMPDSSANGPRRI